MNFFCEHKKSVIKEIWAWHILTKYIIFYHFLCLKSIIMKLFSWSQSSWLKNDWIELYQCAGRLVGLGEVCPVCLLCIALLVSLCSILFNVQISTIDFVFLVAQRVETIGTVGTWAWRMKIRIHVVCIWAYVFV